METNCIPLVGFFLILLVVDCSAADLKVNVSANNGFDQNLNETSNSNEKRGGSKLVLDSSKVDKVKKDGIDQASRSKEGIEKDIDKSNASTQSGSTEAHNVQKQKGVSNKDLQVKEDDNSKEKSGNELLEPKKVPKDGVNGGDLVSKRPLRKEGFRGEECDSSESCTDDDNKFVACLRVPGNDSPDLSLLIQNKGKDPLSVMISAPEFVGLEKTKVQVPGKEGIKVKFSIKNGGSDSRIMLTAGKGRCSLDFRDLIAHNSEKEADASPKLSRFNFMSQTPTVAFLFFGALLILASGWMCISFRRRKLSSNGSKYQKLDKELPVSGGGKLESDFNDGWDNGWDDNWDDEEAPKSPTLPVTPSLSSKGLSSRRLSKEGWKD